MGLHSAERRPRTGVRVATTATLVAAGLLAGAAIAVASWHAVANVQAGTVAAGDLTLTVGAPAWRQTTPGVADPASGTLTTTPADFFAMPGDAVEIRVPVTTFLRGDNLNGALTVTTADPLGDVATSFYVADDAGQAVTAPAPLGTIAPVPGLVGSDAGVTRDWVVVVVVDVLGDYVWDAGPWSDDDGAAAPEPTTWDAGTFTVTLHQVRAGERYVTP